MQTLPPADLQINHQKVLTLSADSKNKMPHMSLLSVAPGIGAATVALRAVIQGETVSVFAERDLSHFDEQMKADPNFSFKQVNVPLFPMSNRLRPNDGKGLKLGDAFQAKVLGVEVKMRLNNQSSQPGAIPHHLHGLTYARPSDHAALEKDRIVAEFKDFFGGLWTGKADLRIEQSLKGGQFHYSAQAQNTGQTPLPVGFGSHPYFQIPSGDASALRVQIPAQSIAEIDNLDNVLPTGRLLPVSDHGHRLDFNQPKALPSGVIDNFFILDPHQAKEVLLEDHTARIRYRFKALSSNIMGVQMFYPGQGSVVAVEFVTHFPDPRKELWKDQATGMQLLKAGERVSYEYELSIESLDKAQ